MSKLKKIIIILFLFFLLFYSCSFASLIDVNYDYLYEYTIVDYDIDREYSSIYDDIKNDDRIVSNSYYYFICQTGSHSTTVLFIPSTIKDLQFKLIDDNYYSNQIFSIFYDDSFVVAKTYGQNKYTVEGNNFLFYGQLNSDTKTFSIPLMTNFPYDISFNMSNGEKYYIKRNLPYIVDSDFTLQQLNGSYFMIKNLGLNLNDVDINFSLMHIVQEDLGDGMTYDKEELVKNIVLNYSSDYYHGTLGEEWFEVPYSAFSGITIDSGNTYNWRLQFEFKGETLYIDRYITYDKDYTFSGSDVPDEGDGGIGDVTNSINDSTNAIIDSNKETQNAIHEQTDAIKENTETNKSIWETLKEVLSYINPFSENFFVYKLIDLLIEGLKSLFVPSDGFFENYFEEIRQWFSDRLGFLWTPFDLIIEILEKIMSIDFNDPILSIPNINEGITGEKIISAQQYNLNSLLENNTFKIVHDIYLVVVDAFIVFAMVNLTKRKIEEVFTK